MGMKILESRNLLDKIKLIKDFKSFDLGCSVAKFKEAAIAELKPLEEGVRMTEKYQKYDEQRIELCKKYAAKNENDKPITDEDGFYVIEDQDAFDLAHAELSEAYTEEQTYRDEQLNAFTKALEGDSAVIIEKVSKEKIKNLDDATVEQSLVLRYFLED